LFVADVAGLACREARIDRPIGPIDLCESLLRGGVFDEHEVPTLAIATSRGLEGNLHALFDDLAFDRSVEIESLANTSGGAENFVGAEVESHGFESYRCPMPR